MAPPRFPLVFSLREAVFCQWRGGHCFCFLPLRGGFFFAPRAMSGRSGWASSPALRPACASDPTALPAVWPLGVGERQPRRLPTPASASGARTRRRDGSCGPRGDVNHPPFDLRPRSWGRRALTFPDFVAVSFRSGWGSQIRLAGGAAISPEATGTPACGSRVGCRGRRLLRTPRGPDPGPHCWVVASGVSARRERGRATAERRLTRQAKQQLHAVKQNLAPA